MGGTESREGANSLKSARAALLCIKKLIQREALKRSFFSKALSDLRKDN